MLQLQALLFQTYVFRYYTDCHTDFAYILVPCVQGHAEGAMLALQIGGWARYRTPSADSHQGDAKEEREEEGLILENALHPGPAKYATMIILC